MRTILTVVLGTIGALMVCASYFVGVYEAYTRSTGWMTVIAAIPMIGQLIWTGVTLRMEGIFDPFIYCLFGGLLLYGMGNFIAGKDEETPVK